MQFEEIVVNVMVQLQITCFVDIFLVAVNYVVCAQMVSIKMDHIVFQRYLMVRFAQIQINVLKISVKHVQQSVNKFKCGCANKKY
jgi:hypothetical protein